MIRRPSLGRMVWHTSHWFRKLGAYREPLTVVACFALVSAFPLWQCVHDMPVLRDPTAMDQAQIARHVARGEGLQTSVIRPLTVALHPEWFSTTKGALAAAKLHPHPEDYYAPVPLVITGLAMAIFGESAKTVRWLVVACFLTSLWLTFVLAKRVSGFTSGLMAMFLLGLSPYLIDLCRAGSLRFVPMPILLLSLLWTVNMLSRPSTSWQFFSLGTGWGIVALSDYNLVVAALLVPLFCLGVAQDRKPKRVLWILAGMLAALLPWMIRNWRVEGSPVASLAAYELITGTRYYPGATIFRSVDSIPDSVWGFVFQHPRSLLLKWTANAAIFWEVLARVVSPFLLGFVVVAWFQRPSNEDQRRLLHLTTLVLVGALMGAFLTICGSERVLICAPLITLLATACLTRVVRRAVAQGKLLGKEGFWVKLSPQGLQASICAAVVVLFSLPLVGRTLSQVPLPPGHPPTFQELSRHLAADEAVVTDIPWAMAWDGSRPSVWLPVLRQRGGNTYSLPVGAPAVYLSPGLMGYDPQPQIVPYQLIAIGKAGLEGMEEPSLLREGGLLFLREGD